MQALLNGLSDMTKTDEYRRYIKLNEHFKYTDDVMAKIKGHNPAYTKAATAGTWEKVFGRTIKQKEKPFHIEVAKNQKNWLFDISQTVGKSPPSICQNVSGKVSRFQAILDCLTAYSVQPIVHQDGVSYYSGIGQDSFTENGKIVLRPALSEQQIIFALVREIIRHTQTSPMVVEAASYMVCRHTNINTADFTFGYVIELLGFDESLKTLKDAAAQDAIIKEAEVFIGHLDANLPFLHESSSGGGDLGLDDRQEDTGEQADTEQGDSKKSERTRPAEERTETVHGIDFRFIKIIRDFMDTPPDKSINMKTIKDYGYSDTKMIPIYHNAAVQLFTKGKEIYKLFKDNTEERVDSIDDIDKHHGLFGITRDDWTAAQAQMVENSLVGEKVKINRWASIVAGEIKKDEDKKLAANNKTLVADNKKSITDNKTPTPDNMNPPNQASENLTAANPAHTPHSTVQVANELDINADGSIVIAADDINHNEIENEVWLETALVLFFEQTGYMPINMPYFMNKRDFEISSEMKKINTLMVYYCAYNISAALNRHKTKAPDTGKARYNVNKAVSEICTLYSDKHISEAIDKHWPDIKAPITIKKAFHDCFEGVRKHRDIRPKKPTPDEDIRRVTAKTEAKATENADTGTEKGSQNEPNERNAEIFHIINAYNKHLSAKPKKPSTVFPIIPPILATAR